MVVVGRGSSGNSGGTTTTTTKIESKKAKFKTTKHSWLANNV